jgi:hypothetical protein
MMVLIEYAHGVIHQALRGHLVHKILHGQIYKHTPCWKMVGAQLEVYTKPGWVTVDEDRCTESAV